jgi:magnesium transporter
MRTSNAARSCRGDASARTRIRLRRRGVCAGPGGCEIVRGLELPQRATASNAVLTIHRDTGQSLRTSASSELPKEVIWIDLHNPSDDEKTFVHERCGFHVPSREALSEIESSSRLAVEDGTIYLSTPLVALGDGDDPHLTPVGFILSPSLLVTVRFDELPAFATVTERLRRDTKLNSGAGVFTALLEAIVDRGADVLERLEGELNNVSRSVFRGDPNKHYKTVRSSAALRHALIVIGRIGDRLSQAREVLLGVDRVVPFVLGLKQAWIVPEFEDRLGAVAKDVASLNAFDDHLANKVQFLLDAVLGFINIAQNDLFKILTIVSVVGIPPTVVVGIYGMNFKFMPELNWTLGYPFGLAMVLLSVLLPLAWFKWRGWF